MNFIIKYKQWIWFAGLWLASLITTLLLAYPLKFLLSIIAH